MRTDALYHDDSTLKRCQACVLAVSDEGIVLDRTVFYAAGGGQPGDSGQLELADGRRIAIADTRRGEPSGVILHAPAAGAELPAPGDTVDAVIDWERRHRHMRLHSALHLLCAIVPAPVTGGRIAADKAHLDFDIDMKRLVKDEIEARLNSLIDARLGVTKCEISEEELDARPELVRTMSVAPPRGGGSVRMIEIAGVDLQPCGGTHVGNTAEIGAVRVVRIRSEGARNKRVTIELT